MKKEVLFVLLDEYADWEGAFLSTSLNFGVMPGSDKKYIPENGCPHRKRSLFYWRIPNDTRL